MTTLAAELAGEAPAAQALEITASDDPGISPGGPPRRAGWGSV